MSLADALKAESVVKKGPVCSVCALLTALDKDDAKALADALDSLTFTHTAISRALRAEGHPISPDTVSRHRKAECSGVHR